MEYESIISLKNQITSFIRFLVCVVAESGAQEFDPKNGVGTLAIFLFVVGATAVR